MSEFEQAVNFVLENEGGYVDNANDSGGVTNHGISMRFLREIPPERLKKYGFFGDIELGHIRDMPIDQAKIIYRGEFWDLAPFEKISDQQICTYLFDCCVLHGLSQGIKLLQRAIWALKCKKDYVKDDGILGEITLGNLGLMTGRLGVLIAERAGYCRLIAQINSKDKEFLDGWIKRCYRI